MKQFFAHIAAGLGPALNSLKYSAITVGTAVLTFMASDPTQPLQSPQTSLAYLQTHWWGILISAFVLPTVRGTQATAQSIQASKGNQ